MLTTNRATDEDGVVYARPMPCVCEECLHENWEECEIGGWEIKKITPKGVRNANEKHLQQQLTTAVAPQVDEWEVESIKSQRIYKGRKQYLVSWKGYTSCTWVYEEDLNADELLEDWEIDNDLENAA